MAAELGTVAAIVQFLDIAGRLSVRLSRLCSDLKDAPERIQDLHSDLTLQLQVAQDIKSRHATIFAPVSGHSVFDHPMQDYISLADTLCSELEGLLISNNDNVFQRRWKDIRAVKKKEDILEVCTRLEQKRSNMNLWLAASNRRLIFEMEKQLRLTYESGQKTLALAKEMEVNGKEMLAVAHRIEQRSQTNDAKVGDILMEVQQVRHHTATTVVTSDRSLTGIEQVDKAVANFESKMHTSLGHIEDVNSEILAESRTNNQTLMKLTDTINQFHLLVQNNPALSRTISQLASRSELTTDQAVDSGSLLRDIYIENDKADLLVRRHPADENRICLCRRSAQSLHWEPISYIHFRRTFRRHHFSWCPQYVITGNSLELLVSFVPPSWLLAHTVNLSFKLKGWQSRKGTEISPIVVGTSRVVDRSTSLSFAAISNVKEKLIRNNFIDSAKSLPTLKIVLEDLFANQKASALDQDRDGNTVLSELLCLYIEGAHREVNGETADAYLDVVRFLLTHGANPNTLITGLSRGRYVGAGVGNAYDDFVLESIIAGKYYTPSRVMHIKALINLLASAEGEFSIPMNIFECRYQDLWCDYFSTETSRLRRFPEQIDLSDYGILVPLILEKSADKLKRAIRRQPSLVNHRSSVDGLSPIHFTIEWPKGLEILLEAGAGKDSQDNYGRSPLHLAVGTGYLESVDVLLHWDCNLCPYMEGFSLVQQALHLECSKREEIITVVTTAVIDRHRRLVDFAKRVLPETLLSEFGIFGVEISESRSKEICAAIRSLGIDVPRELILGNESVYETTAFAASIRMTTELAERFWVAGFRDIHHPTGSHGLSPILQNWFIANLDMVAWFIDKGVSPYSMHGDGGLSGLHLYASRFGYLGGYFISDPTRVESNIQLFDQLMSRPDLYHDDCRCICSPEGCTPIKFVFSGYHGIYFQHFHEALSKSIKAWIKKTAPSKEMMSQYYREIARLVFCKRLKETDSSSTGLKIKHTCCGIGPQGERKEYAMNYTLSALSSYSSSSDKYFIAPETSTHLEEEDESHSPLKARSLEEAFERGMKFYELVRKDYQGPPEELPLVYYHRLDEIM